MKEIYIKASVGNNRLKVFRERFGHYSIASLSRATGISHWCLSHLERFKMSPRKMKGRRGHPSKDVGWRKPVLMLSNYFGVEPEEIFPPDLWYLKGTAPILREVGLEDLALNNPEFLPALPRPEDHVIELELRKNINDVLSTLTPREQVVLKRRFGIGDESPQTLETVATEFKVGRERIRAIEAKALRKLRHPARAYKLKVFLET